MDECLAKETRHRGEHAAQFYLYEVQVQAKLTDDYKSYNSGCLCRTSTGRV